MVDQNPQIEDELFMQNVTPFLTQPINVPISRGDPGIVSQPIRSAANPLTVEEIERQFQQVALAMGPKGATQLNDPVITTQATTAVIIVEPKEFWTRVQ